MRKNEDVALISEMYETANLIRGFDFSRRVGLRLGVNLDKTKRARKIGNSL